jgi:hypothetical protein
MGDTDQLVGDDIPDQTGGQSTKLFLNRRLTDPPVDNFLGCSIIGDTTPIEKEVSRMAKVYDRFTAIGVDPVRRILAGGSCVLA